MRQHSGIGVLDKAMAVLYAVAEQPCGLNELCTRTGLPRATAHRLAVGLETHRMLARDAAGSWRPGPALSELAT
ncbi:helix-turn-helix domain-containing protein, partial [Nocardia nova]